MSISETQFAFSYSLAASSVEDVYEYLWEKNKDIANKTLGTDFLIQMQNGSLQAERYVNFTIQDIGYLLKVTKMLKSLSGKKNQPTELRDFMKDRYLSYKSFADSMLKQYFFKVRTETQTLNFQASSESTEDALYSHFSRVSLPSSRLQL